MESKSYQHYEPQYFNSDYNQIYNATQASPMLVEETEVNVPRPEEYHFEDPPAAAHSKHRNRNLFLWALRYGAIVIVVAVALAAPVIAFRGQLDQSEIDDASLVQKQYENLIFYLFSWLLATWLSGCACDIIALNLPYIFRFIARYVNPGHMRYWRMFRPMRLPITMLGTMMASFVAFDTLIPSNALLSVNFYKTAVGWDDIIDILFFLFAIWVGLYFVEKLGILYITIHHHYRSNWKQIERSKEMHNALVALYDASLYLHPVGSKVFEAEDSIIRNSKGLANSSSRKRVTTYLSKMGVDSYGMTSFFGNFFSEDPKSHWLKPASSYAVVERCLGHPTAGAALAKRIWSSISVSGKKSMNANDIAEVLGPYRTDEANELFKVLDVNEIGDLRLDEMVWTVVEAGQIRSNVYRSMHDADHCINTFDWVCLTILAAVMVFFILVTYVPTIKDIQQTLSFVAIGLSFAVGRTFNHFLVGVVYVFFDHPFDIGDRVEIYNIAANKQVSAIVTKQSLLYTCFRRIDNGLELQISNERLSMKRIENASRSGLNRQSLSIFVDFRTTFKDIMYLKSELIEFLTDAENRRDFQPDLALSVVNLHELNKMEIKLSFSHKSNWSNEKLRATRSNKFMCALVGAMRKVPIYGPGKMTGTSGDAEKPIYTVMINDQEAAAKIQAGNATRQAKRYDAPRQTSTAESAPGNEAERDAAEQEAAAKKAAKEAADADEEEGAFMRMTAIPVMPVEMGIRGGGSSSAIEVESIIGQTLTGLRNTSSSGEHSGGYTYQ